eukprot:SAG31_NODE_792_length_12047_cov_14.428607_7_plen_316_part_00
MDDLHSPPRGDRRGPYAVDALRRPARSAVGQVGSASTGSRRAASAVRSGRRCGVTDICHHSGDLASQIPHSQLAMLSASEAANRYKAERMSSRNAIIMAAFTVNAIAYVSRSSLSVMLVPMSAEFGWAHHEVKGHLLSAFFYGNSPRRSLPRRSRSSDGQRIDALIVRRLHLHQFLWRSALSADWGQAGPRMLGGRLVDVHAAGASSCVPFRQPDLATARADRRLSRVHVLVSVSYLWNGDPGEGAGPSRCIAERRVADWSCALLCVSTADRAAVWLAWMLPHRRIDRAAVAYAVAAYGSRPASNDCGRWSWWWI